MSRKFLYRRLGSAVIVILAFFAVMVPRGSAQGRPQLKRPEDTPQEKPPEPKKKKVKGPRAVGLLQLGGSGKGTLIPIAILVDGKFYDASAYKADPVPMALESGTVYEAEQSGDSQGLFTVNGALHSKNQGSAHPWVGAGSYLPNGTEVAKATRKAEDVPVGLDSNDSDAPPRLTRGNTAKPAATSNPSSAPSSGTPAGAGSSEKPAGPSAPPVASQPASGSSGGGSAGEDAQKPTAPAASDKSADQSVKQQAPAPTAGQTTAGQASSSQSTSGQSTPGQSSSEQTSPAQKSQAQASPGQASQGQAEDYYRPALRRGKPTQSAPQEEETASKTGKPESGAMAAVASSGPVQLVPAISDAGGPDPRTYKFFWKTGEEEERRNQMLALAGSEVQAYANALARNRIPAKPPAAKAATAGHKAPAKPIQPVLENVQFRAFDVWGNNQPVMILSAEGALSPCAGGERSAGTVLDYAGDPHRHLRQSAQAVFGSDRQVSPRRDPAAGID